MFHTFTTRKIRCDIDRHRHRVWKVWHTQSQTRTRLQNQLKYKFCFYDTIGERRGAITNANSMEILYEWVGQEKKKANRKNFREYFAYRSIHAVLEIHEFIDHSSHAMRELFGHFNFNYSWIFLQLIPWPTVLLYVSTEIPSWIHFRSWFSISITRPIVCVNFLSSKPFCRWPERLRNCGVRTCVEEL